MQPHDGRRARLAQKSLLGRSLLDLCDESAHERVVEALASVGFGKAESAGEVPLLTASGSRIMAAISATRVTGASGEERLRLVCRDVTVERQLEEQLTRAQRLEAIGRLSGGIAHDFNNLLLVVQGASSLLRDTLETHAIDASEIDLIETAATRGAALTNDLLAFARQQVTSPVPTDVRDVVRDTERMIGRVIGDEIRLRTVLGDTPVVVLVDPAQLGQVLLNLAINARDAMPRGGTLTLGTARIETRFLDEGRRPTGGTAECAHVSVTDSGEGMPAEVVLRAFDPFFSTKPVGKGTGLGLAMCYGIVTQAGGKIVIGSEVGRGTRIDIFLPLSQRPAVAPRRQSSRPRGTELLLLVEDDPAAHRDHERAAEQRIHRAELRERTRGRRCNREQRETVRAGRHRRPHARHERLGDRACASQASAAAPRVVHLRLSRAVPEPHRCPRPDLQLLAKPYTPDALLSQVRALLDRCRA